MKATRTEPRTRADHLRHVLRARLRSAQKRNSRYSLRAFAKQLGVDHSTLSQLLRGKRPLTAKRAELFARRLGLAADVVRDHARALENARRETGRRRVRSKTFDADTFAFVSQWPHSAILELTHLASFTPDSRWIAGTLGLEVADVNVALQRLLRLRLLEMSSPDRWTDRSGDLEFVGAGVDEGARREVIRSTQELAMRAADHTALDDQAHGRMVVAMERSRLGELRDLIDRFMIDARTVSDSSTADAVYQVSVAIHPLTRAKRAESSATKSTSEWR